MKKTATLILLTIISSNAFAKCDGHSWLSIYSDSLITNSYTNNNLQTVTAFFAPGDWAEVRIQGETMCSSSALLLNNGDTLLSGLMPTNNIYLTLTDTGHYLVHFVSSIADWTWEFSINYTLNTSLQDATEPHPFLIYPSGSQGIYHLQTKEKLKHIIVFDRTGKAVFEATRDFAEINLFRFSNGVYFYAITDENEKVWRGKLLKD